VLAVFGFAGLAACADREPLEPARASFSQRSSQGQSGAIDRFPELVDSLPDVRLPAVDHAAAEPTDAELVEAVARAGGNVMIGLKPAAARRTRETGVVPGISRATALAARAAVRAFGAEIIMSYRHSSAVAATIRPTQAPGLRRLPMVDYVEPLFPAQLMAQVTSWGAKKVNAPAVWAGLYGLSTGGEGVSVTILDAGVDEVHRWWGDGPANMNFDCRWVQGTGNSCYADQTDPDRIGHGAHVAGIIASLNNGAGYVGIASNLQQFESIKVCDRQGVCLASWVADGLDWVLGSGRPRHIVNMSFGWCTNHTVIGQMVASLANAGVLLIGSAGNYWVGQTLAQACRGQQNDLGDDWPTGVYFPARHPQVMAVSGTLENDAFATAPPIPPGGGDESGGGGCGSGDMCGVPNWCFVGSRFGPQVEIAAPFWAHSMWTGGTYKAACGTSMSAPYVAGVAALVWSLNPGLTASEVRVRLTSSAVHYYPIEKHGSGRVDAVNAVYPPPPPPSLSVTIEGPSPVPASTFCTWIAGASGGTEPYSYQWTVNGSPAGNGTNTLGISTPGSDFTISVVATSANGLTGVNAITVGVGGVTSCNEQ
jgi:subtilisin family serine protease